MELCEERLAKRKEEHRQRELQRHLEEQERVVRRASSRFIRSFESLLATAPAAVHQPLVHSD